MPSLSDMMEYVDLLKVKAIEVDELKCVAVRNRNSRCKKCAEACIADAITVSHNEVKVDAGACVNCGCCVSVCPTAAIRALDPTSSSVVAEASEKSNKATGMVVISCERKAAMREGDPDLYVSVPCLGHMTDEGLLALAAKGLDDIVLVDGNCATCKFGAASPHIDETVANVAKIMEAVGSEAIITRSSEFPPEVVNVKKANKRGESRRGIMKQTGSYVKTVAGNVAQKTIEDRLGASAKEPVSLRERLGTGLSGRIPTFEPSCNYRLLDNMTALAKRDDCELCESDKMLETRHFGEVAIDAEKCSGCGMCVLFCPTAALKYAEYDEPADETKRYLEFQAADCTQCMLCKDVCLRYCLEVSPEVQMSELCDFEPTLIEIARPQNRTSILDIKNRNKH